MTSVSPQLLDAQIMNMYALITNIQKVIQGGHARSLIISLVNDESFRQITLSKSVFYRALSMAVRSHGDVGIYLIIELGEKALEKK